MVILSLSPVTPIGDLGQIITIRIESIDHIFRYDYNPDIDIYSMAVFSADGKILSASRHLIPVNRELIGITNIQNLYFPSFPYPYLIFLDNNNIDINIKNGFYQGGRYDLLALDQEGYELVKS